MDNKVYAISDVKLNSNVSTTFFPKETFKSAKKKNVTHDREKNLLLFLDFRYHSSYSNQ